MPAYLEPQKSYKKDVLKAPNRGAQTATGASVHHTLRDSNVDGQHVPSHQDAKLQQYGFCKRR